MSSMTGKQRSVSSQKLSSWIEATVWIIEGEQMVNSNCSSELYTIGSLTAHHAVHTALTSEPELQDNEHTQELLSRAARNYHTKLVKEGRKDPFTQGLKNTLKEIFWDIESGNMPDINKATLSYFSKGSNHA